MLIGRLLTRPCVITSRTDSGEVNDYGDPVPTDAEVNTTCELQKQLRRASEEPAGHGEFSDTLWELFLPAGTEIGTGDVVTVDGLAYEMVGAPWPVRHPRTGQETHVEATVRRTA
jgi:hypothetical protein